MLGRFAPKTLAYLVLFIIILQCLYNKQAIAKPRPKQYLTKEQWTGNVQEEDYRHWSDLSIEKSINGRDKRSAVDREDSLEGQKGFKVLTATNDKREGIQTPIEAVKTEGTPLENAHELKTSRSNVNEPNGGSGGSTNAVPQNTNNNSQQNSATSSSLNEEKASGSGSNIVGNIAGEKRGEVTLHSAQKAEESKTQSNNVGNNANSKQDSGTSSATSDSNDKAKQSTNSPNPSSSVTIQGNTVNGQPISSSSSSSSSEAIKDPVGNSGSEVVTSHPSYENEAENSQFPYRDDRSKEGSKGSSEPEVGHFQVDDKSADLEINANSAGVKVKAKPASLQVVSRPGAHPPTPVVPIAPIHPYYHHHHHYYPFLGGFRRSRRPYHRRLYDNPYHAHYRTWIPPPGHRHYRPYFEDPEDVPFYRRAFNPYRYGYHHRHHHHHHRYPMEMYERSDVEDMYHYPMYRRGFRGPYRRGMYGRQFGAYPYDMPESRFHIPRRPREFVRHDIVTPVPPPVNVYGNPPPGILKGEAASMFGMSGMGGLGGMNAFNGMPGIGGFGMGGPLLPGMNGPGFSGLGMNAPGMFGMMGMNDQLGDQGQFNGISRSLGPRYDYSEPRYHVKKAAIQGVHKKTHVKPKAASKKKTKNTSTKKRTKISQHSKLLKSTVVHAMNFTKGKHRSRRSAEPEPKKTTVKKLRPQKVKEQKGNRKNSIVIHRPPIIYHPPPEIYHRPDIVVHRAPIMLHRPSIIYHQPPVVVHRPAIIYHQPSIVFHQPPPVVHQPIMHSHDTYVTRPVVLPSGSMMSHPTSYLGIPNHVYSDYEGFHGDGHEGFHGEAFRKHSVPHDIKTVRAEIQGKIFKKSETSHQDNPLRPKRDIYTKYLDNLDYLSEYWKPKVKRHVKDDFDAISSKEASSEALTYNDVEPLVLDKRNKIPRYQSFLDHIRNAKTSRKKRDIDADELDDNDDNNDDNDDNGRFIRRKKKKDVVVNRPPIIYHPPPEVYHRPDIVVHRPPLVIHRPPIIYHQPPVIVHRPAVVYHQPPIVFHQPPPAVSQPLLFSHDSFTIHPSFYATHHGSVVRDYGHYIGIPNIVSNYGAPLFHSGMGKRSKISKPEKKKSARKSSSEKPTKKTNLHHKKAKTENPHKKNSVVIRRPPIIYHPPPEIYHRPDIVVHRAPIMIHRAPIVYHQPPVVVHRPAIVYHQPSLVFHQPPPAVHQPLITSHDTWVTHSVPVPFSSHVTHHTAYVGIPKHAYMNFHDHWGGHDDERAYYKSEVPKNVKGSQRDNISKAKKHTVKKSLKHKHVKEEKAKRKNSVMIKRPPIIYHPPPEIFHRPDIVVHRPPILVHRAPIVYHQPPVIVHRPPIVYHQPNIVFHQPMPMVQQPIMQSHDTWVTRPAIKLYGSTMHRLGAVTQYPHAYYNGHHNLRYMAYGKSKVPKKEEKGAARDEIKHDKATVHDGEDVENSGDDDSDGDGDEIVESGSGSGYGELDIEVITDDKIKSNLHKSKTRTESASKKDKISKVSNEKQQETTVKGSKKNSVVIHRPPIIYHPPPEIYHRPDIVVHRAPIVLYRAPIIYHQPPVVVHRPAIVYHQPSIVFHQPPPMVHQPIVHSHDNYVTHSVAVPVGSHVTHVMNYHGVPHEEIYMEGIGHGAFAKSMLPLHKGHKRDNIKTANVAKGKNSENASKRSRRALEEEDLYFGAAESPLDVKQPIGASERIKRVVEQPWISNLDSSSVHVKELNKRNKESGKTAKSSKKKKKDVVVSRPPIIYHPPPEVYHRPEIVVHRAPILIHRPPIVYHQPPVVVHRPAVVYHQPPIVFHQPPPSVNQPLLFSHDQFILHPTSVAQHINSVVNEAGHYVGIPHGGIENYPGPLLTHPFGAVIPSFAGYHVKRGKVQKPNDKGSKSDTSSSEENKNQEEDSGQSSGDGEIPSRRAKTRKNKQSKGQRKNNVMVYRPPMIYHPPPEIYDRPDIVVHRPDLVIHRPSIVYHQPSVVIHRPPIIYHQPPVMFHQPPPLNHQPIIHSHDTYVGHRYFEPYGSVTHHAGSYVGAPHFYPGENAYGWGMQGFHRPLAAVPGFGFPYGPAFGRSKVQKASKKSSKEKKKAHEEKASKKSRHGRIRHKRSNKHHRHHHWHHKHLKRHAYRGFVPVYTLMEQHESFITNPLSKNYLGESSPQVGEPAYTKSKVASSGKSKRSTKEKSDKKQVKKHKKGERKNMIVVHRPPMIYHPPPEVYDRPDVVVHRPDIVIHRPSVVYHQPSVVVHRPPVIYHEPPVVFHQPSPMVHHPVIHAHDTYVSHPFYEPYASHVQHAGSYVGAPHFFGGGFGYGYGGFGPAFGPGFGPGIGAGYGPGFGPGFVPGFGLGFRPPFGRSKIEKRNKSKSKSKKRSRRSTKTQKKASKTGSKKNMVLIQRPPMIYHPPPEIYDRPNVIVHRPDLVIHRPSIVYHQPSVVIHRPPVIYQQPPVVFHQPPPLNTQPVLHAHDSYIAHTYHEPFASSLHHAGTYVGAPHFYPSRWGVTPNAWGPAFGKSKVPKAKGKGKILKRAENQRSRRDVDDKSKKIEKKTKTSKSSKSVASGHKKNVVVMRRPPVIYHPPPEVYHRPDVILHRPDIVIHRPSVVFHQSAVVIHRPSVVYHQPPLVFHQPTPMVHQPILHSHETYLPHHYFEPAGAHVIHSGTYVGAPHFYHGGWGWGYGYHAGHSFGKSKIEDSADGEAARKAKTLKKTKDKDKEEDDDDDEIDAEHSDDESKTAKSKSKSRRSLKTVSKSHKNGNKKNIVVMRRPPVVYHPPPEVYHRPDVVLHRPDIVIHRPSVVFHQSPVVIHRPSVVYHQPPIVFHQPTPMVHQPIVHSHDTYLPHHFYEPFHAHVVHAGTYVGAPHFFGGGWGWGYGHGHGHAFGKSKVEKTKKSHHHKTKRDTKEDKHSIVRMFQKFVQKRSLKGSKKDSPSHPSHKGSKKSVKGTKKNMVLIQRPPMIYHPPPEIYDRPNIIVHRPDLVYHQPSIVYHQSSVVVHRAPVIYHPPPVVFHQPPPLVHQNVLHSHDSYIGHQFYEPFASHISHGQTYVGAPHFFGGGWGYGYGLHGPLNRPVGPWNGFGPGPMFRGPFMYNALGFHGPGFHGPVPSNAGFHGFAPQAVHPFGPAFAKSNVERPKGNATKKSHKAKHTRKSRSLSLENKKSHRVKSRNRHHKGLKKNVVVMHRAPIMFHPPPEVYHRPDIVIHRPDVVIHRPSIVVHQAPVVVHKPTVVYHQSPVVLHQPPPLVHQPLVYSHDTYVPHTYYEPFGSSVAHAGTYFGAPHAFDGGWGYGYGHVVGGFGKSKVEKTKSSSSKKANKGTKKSKAVKSQENASKKVNILHPELEKDVKAEKKNDIVVNRPPIIYHPPPEVYHRPDIVVHRAPIVVHRPPIIYHQPPVVVHRPAVVYHQPPIVFHQPPPAVHQPIIHSHDTFVVHHTAMYEPHGSTVSHQTNFIGIPSHVEHFDEGFDYHGGHEGYHDDFVEGYHGYHGGFHGGFHGGYHGYRMLHRSNIEHAKKSDKVSDSNSEESSSTKSTITKTEAPVKKENTNTVITDEDQPSKTVTKRQILGSHSLFLSVSPLNVVHPKGPIVERLQKMSTIPGVPKAEYEHHVAKRDLDSQKEKRQVLVNPGIQAPLNYALAAQRILHPIASHVAGPIVASPPAIYPRLPLYQPLLQAPYFPGYPSLKPPRVNVHVETERSSIPDKKKKRGSRQRRQVLPVMQPDVFGNVPHLLYNQAPVSPFLHEAAPQLPQQMASPFLGFNPMMVPSYPLMNYLPQRRPHVNINVQSMRSSIPASKRKRKSVSKRRSKRQLPPRMINPYVSALNYLNNGFNPYWNMNMNPLFVRRSPGILGDDDGDESEPESQNVDLMKQYLTNLYEYYTGEKFDHKRPKVDVEVHASKSNIPGSSASNIVVRSRRQMFTYLPQSPLTTGRYDIPVSGPLSSLLPLKRSKVSKPKRSTKKDADKKMKSKEFKSSNSKRDEFAPQDKNEQSNLIQMNPDDLGASILGGDQNTQFSRVEGGAEGMNEIGTGGLNGAIVEPQGQQSQTKAFFERNSPEEPQNQESLQQELMQQQQDFPVAGFQGNNQEQVPNFPQLQDMQTQDRMELPVNEEQLLRLRGQVPFFPPGPQIPLERKPLLIPGPSRAFFFPPPVAPPQPVPLFRPFAPFPFAPIPAQQAPFSFPMQSPMASFFPEQQQQQQQGTINVNVNTAKSKLPRVKSKKKTTDEQNNTEKQNVPGADEIKSGDKRQRISLFQRIPAMQVLPQRFLQNGVAVPSFAGSEPHKESQIHGVNGMVISELQMQRKHAIPSKVDTKNIQAGNKKSDLVSHDAENSHKSKSKRQIYGMNELPQEIKSQQDQTSSKKFQTRVDKEQEKKVQKRYIEIIRRALSEKASDSSKTSSKDAENTQQVGMSSKKSSLSKTSNLGHRKRQFVMPFGVPNIGVVAEQVAQEQAPLVIHQYQQDPQQFEQVMSPQQTHIIQEPEAAYDGPFSNELAQASEPGVAYLGHRPKVHVNVQVAKSSIGKGLAKEVSQDKKTTNSKKDKTITKRQLFGTVPLFSPLGRADVSKIVKAYFPDSKAILKQQQVPVVSRRSHTNQMHEQRDNSKTKYNKQKRQLGDLINNILERRRGPKLLGDLLKKPKENPPIVFTTGNNNNNDEKPIDVFPGNPGGNQNPGEGQARLGDAGVVNPLAGFLPPPPPLQTNQNPLLNGPAMPGNQGMYQDDQSAIAAAQAAQQPPPLPLLRQQEPVTRQNVLQFLQNAGLPNPLVQQPLSLGPQMPAAPFMPPVLPWAMPQPPPVMPQPPSNDAASPAEGRSQTPLAQLPPVFQLPPQGAPQMAPFAMGPPQVFPMMPFNAAQAPFFPYPPVQPAMEPGPGIPGSPSNHLFDKPDDDRPSVSVNVQTSKSKIPKTDKS